MADSTQDHKPIRLGVLGAGSVFTRGHLPALQALPHDFQITAIARGDAAKLAEALRLCSGQAHAPAGGCAGFKDWRELVASPQVDAVLIASPNALHAPQALAAIEAGKDVLCEKPPAVSHAQASEVAASAQRLGRIVQYGFLMRYADETRTARQAIEQGRLGQIYHVRACWLRRRGYPTKGSWFTTQALSGGGVLVDLGSHLLDRALYLLGNPTVVSVSALTHARMREAKAQTPVSSIRRSGNTGICDVEDLAVCLFRLKGGLSLILETSFAANLPEQPPITEILGDRAGLRIERGGVVSLFGEESGAVTDTQLPAQEPKASGAGALYRRQLEAFAHAIRSRQSSGADAASGAGLMRALEAAYRSAQLGREVTLE